MNTNPLSPKNNQYTYLDNNFSNFSNQLQASTQNSSLYGNTNPSFSFNEPSGNNSNLGYNNTNTNMNVNMNMNLNLGANKKTNNSFDLI